MDGSANEHFVARVTQLLEVTRRLPVARARLQSAYDTWVQQRGTHRMPPGFLYSIAAAMDRTQVQMSPPPDPARNGDALALALAMLPGDEDVIAFFGAAIAAGIFDAPGRDLKARDADRRKAMEILIQQLGRDALEQVLPIAKLQNAPVAEEQAHDEHAIWIDPGHLLPAIILARRRLCRIVRIRRSGTRDTLGTGFLIGPSTVLTNHHVVEDINKQTLREDELLCWFDYSETTGGKKSPTAHHHADPDWKIAVSPVGLKQAENPTHEWWEDEDKLEEWLGQVKDTLDYAVIRLATTPGLQRGWYDLKSLQASTSMQAIVLHHPTGADQTITLGRMSVSNPKDVRLFHQAATASGSSGGLVLNEYGQPIGLHHMGLHYSDQIQDPTDPTRKIEKKRFMNVAINLQNVAADLEANGMFDKIEKLSPITPVLGCIDGGHPIFGRSTLLKDLRTMWEDDNKRILMVHVRQPDPAVKSPGKSFTTQVIQGLFRRPEDHHIVFKAGQTDADALAFARRTVKSFAEDLVHDVPAEPDTTTTAYVQILVNFVVGCIEDRLSNGSVWLMIDDLDRHSLSDASGREFLATLYNRVTGINNLRVVLIGLPEDIEISGIDQENLLRSTIDSEDLTNFDALFKAWLEQRSSMRGAIGEDAVDLVSGIVGSYAQQNEPLHAMAEFVVNHMTDIAKKLFGDPDMLPTTEEDT